LASAHMSLGDGAAALAAAKEAVSIGRAAGDRAGEAAALHAAARAHLLQGGKAGREGAFTSVKEGLDIFATLGDQSGEASCLLTMATMLLHSEGRLAEAMSAAERSRKLFLLVGDQRHQGLATHAVAQGNLMLGEVDYGLQTAMQAVVLARDAGDKFGEAAALHTATHAVVRKGRYGEALRMASEVQGLFRKMGNKQMEEAARRMVDQIKEALPTKAPGPSLSLRTQDDTASPGYFMRSITIDQKLSACVIWSAPVNQHMYIRYCLEFLKLVDDLKTAADGTKILVTTQGVTARQSGQDMAATKLSLNAATVWAMCRTLRLESPRLHLATIDLPLGATAHELTDCLNMAQDNSGPRSEIAFFMDRRNKLSVNTPA